MVRDTAARIAAILEFHPPFSHINWKAIKDAVPKSITVDAADKFNKNEYDINLAAAVAGNLSLQDWQVY